MKVEEYVNNSNKILKEVSDYYSEKLAEHGNTPKGVDWNGEESQVLRFEQLTKVIHQGTVFSVNDYGCGYGALLYYLNERYADFNYNGCDISTDMINAAQAKCRDLKGVKFYVAAVPETILDYGVASGVFNVRFGRSDIEWKEYVEQTLDIIDRTCRRGFAFNCLTSYSDTEKKRDYLYYADPLQLFDYCKRRYSRNVALLHDYGLYEFTILITKLA